LCEASDTFALQQIHTDPPPHSASSAHTYRLLVFKDRSAQPAAPELPPPGTASFASLRLQQRSGIMESDRQPVKPLLRISFGSKDSRLRFLAHTRKRVNSRQT
ncbi:hypothetical protein, partial [Paraburkholderia sp. BR14374]|uniref:hypothetical protein n=1 Tax=Paraburkholderia sp. BR14374 TaxID=3237007 RepID=UPI0034CE12D4